MDIAHRVHSFLENASAGSICDDCIQRSLALVNRQQAWRVTNGLATTPMFSKEKTTCSMCGSVKNSTRLVSANFDDRPCEVIKQPTILGLLRSHANALESLRELGVLRTKNNPAGDYAEHLCAEAFGWTLSDNSAKGVDATDRVGMRFQIKARRVTPNNGSRQLSDFSDLEAKNFDWLAGVVFGSDFTVEKAALIPWEGVVENGRRSSKKNCTIFHLRDSVWNLPNVKDITSNLAAVQNKP